MRRVVFLSAGALIAAAILGGGTYAGIWFVNARGAEAAVLNWAERTRTAGYDVQIGTISVSGFPNSVELDLTGITVGQPSSAIPWAWRADSISGSSNKTGTTLRVLGEQTLTYTSGGKVHSIRVAARRFRIKASGAVGGDRSVSLDIRDMFLDRPGDLGRITAERVQLRADLGAGSGVIPGGTQVLVSLKDLVLPEHRRGPLGDTIAVLHSEMVFTGAIETLDLPVALANWRDGEGRIILTNCPNCSVLWGTLEMKAHGGTLWLDEAFRPAGGFTGSVRGYSVTIDAFHAAGRFTNEDIADIRAMLNFVNQRGPAAEGAISLPVAIEDGLVTVGRATLGAVPRLLPGSATD